MKTETISLNTLPNITFLGARQTLEEKTELKSHENK